MKKVLIIIRNFPPSSIVDSLRFYKFVRNFAENDWQAIILTRMVYPEEDRYDEEIMKSMPKGIKIFRIKLMDLMTAINQLRKFGN